MKDTFIPQAPANSRLYSVGDIHGCHQLLQQLMTKIAEDAAASPTLKKELIFLGDYIDRGLGSRETIEHLIHSKIDGVEIVYLRGNHEEILLRIIDGDLDSIPSWLQYGGIATLASYGIPLSHTQFDNHKMIRSALQEKVPAHHIEFLEKSRSHYESGDYYFVHAGLRPGLSLEKQNDRDRLWIREPFLSSSHHFGKVVVHGHSISMDPELLPNRIGIDTGAYATGRLTCLVLEGQERRLITT